MPNNTFKTTCPSCHLTLPETENQNPIQFCPFCGEKLPAHVAQPITEVEVTPTLSSYPMVIFMGTLLLSLTMTWVLNTVFHFPIFIAGAFLPLLFWPRKKTSKK